MTDPKYEECPECGAALFLSKEGSWICKLCGYSNKKESDNKEPSYIG